MNEKVKKILKIGLYPAVRCRRYVLKQKLMDLAVNNPKSLASLLYKSMSGRELNWDNPQDLSEKINWMKFYGDTTKWTELADKYRVRKYVESKGLQDILVKLYGVWSNADDIDFDTLPNSFVLKTNNACGTVLLVKDKRQLDIPKVRKQLNDWLAKRIGILTVEHHYLSISPVIIAEEYLQPKEGLIDYKLHVVHGETELVLVCSDRKIGVGAQMSLYDKNWNPCSERLGACHAHDDVKPIPRPVTFEKMKEYAKILCKDFPFVRMDFYEVNGHVYFGEMTFTPKGGYCSTLTYEEQLRLGKMITLPHLIDN